MKSKNNINMIFRMLKIMSILMILSAGAGFFIGNKYSWICFAALVLIAGVCLILIFNQQSNVEDKILQIASENEELKSDLEKSDDLRARFRAALEKESNAKVNLEQELLHKSLQTQVQTPQILKQFKTNVSTPYFGMLNSMELPLSVEDKQFIVDRTIEVAMLAIDMADAYDWNINNREEQKLNLDLIKNTSDKQSALAKATVITDNPALTPRWARALYQSFNTIVSKNNDIIYSGFKFDQKDE